jgi:acyl-CoA thioesterase I
MSPLVERDPWKSRKHPPAPRRYGDSGGVVNIALALCVGMMLAARPFAAVAGPAPRILAFGDSLTAGLGLTPDAAFPARLEALLRADGVDARVINGGVSGETTAGGVARLDWALGDHPDLVILELGANDALRGIDPQLAYANLDKILARLKASGAKVLLTGMLAPPNWGREYQQEFAAIFPKLAEKYQVPLYPFFLDGVATDPSLNQPDGLHPNAPGAQLIAAKVAPYVERLLRGETATQ